MSYDGMPKRVVTRMTIFRNLDPQYDGIPPPCYRIVRFAICPKYQVRGSDRTMVPTGPDTGRPHPPDV